MPTRRRKNTFSRTLMVLILAVPFSGLAAASPSIPALRSGAGWRASELRQNDFWISALRESEFDTVPHPTAFSSCAISDPPEALATPDPLVELSGSKRKVSVSFIVGTDGKVHSPFILDSAGVTQDQRVLDTVRSWRYRPAKCNGVPAEAEGKVQFLVR